jgi:Putative Ig domain
MPILGHRNRGAWRFWLGVIAASCSALLRVQAQSPGDVDVSLVFVDKTQRFQQKTLNTPVAITNPFSLKLGANARNTNSIVSGQFRVPPATNAFQNLSNDGVGNLSFVSGSFATAAALNTAFPNGTYTFNLVTATVPQAYTANVPIGPGGDAYPATIPRITGGTFSSGALQVDSTINYNFNWNTFSGAQIFQIVDASNKVVFSQSLSNTTGVLMAAKTLQPGQYYTASLIYQTRTIVFQDTNTTWLATFSLEVDFKIATISAIPAITSPTTITATVGQAFFYQIIATNHPFSYTANPLPPGLVFDSTLGVISGIPTASGSFQINLSASNIDGTGFAGVNNGVQNAPGSGPIITSSTSALAYSGKPFSFQVITKGATSAARISATGLPAGLTIDPVNGHITGTTNAVGSVLVTLTVVDGGFRVAGSLQLTFTADVGYPVITNADTVTVPRGQFFTYTIATPGATDPVDPPVYTMIGTLPQGLGFNAATGTISGTYTGPLDQSAAMNSGGDSLPQAPTLSGGALLGSIQLFGTNSHGTSTFQLLFLAPPSGAVNISTRVFVGTGDNVLIGGFIVTGNAPKVVIIRALGPSTGAPGALQDPVLELHDSHGGVVTNDNWRTTQEQIIKDTTIPPPDDRESAIVIALDPGNYTAIVSGKNGSTGIALVEVYDLGTASLDSGSIAKLAQISTRGNVLTGDNVMIGGFFVSGVTTKILLRAIGPSLTAFGVANAVQDTTLELHNGQGATIGSNDDWRSDQEQAIKDTTIPPTDDRESAILQSLAPGPFTVILRGKNNTTGVALVEVYALP